MLHHISVAVNNPLHVAQVLAEVLNGRCFPFPIHAGSYITIVEDGFGTAIEFYPIDVQLTPDGIEVGFSSGNLPQVFSSVHAAFSVSASQIQIEAIANREGWLVRHCDRGPFQVIELWVENRFMLEMLPPEMAQTYLEFATPGNYEAFLNQVLVEA